MLIKVHSGHCYAVQTSMLMRLSQADVHNQLINFK